MAFEDDVRRALGTLCLIWDRPPTDSRRKLEQIRQGGMLDLEQAAYMALAFCFDLVRRSEYTFMALKKFGPQADPEIVRRFADENNVLEQLGQDYRRIAEALEEMILQLTQETVPEHQRMQEQVLGGKSKA